MAEVMRIANLNAADLKDVLDNYEIPRIEKQEDSILVFLRLPYAVNDINHTSTFALIITNESLITLSMQDNPLIDDLMNYPNGVDTTNIAELLSRILLDLSYAYTSKIKSINNAVASHRKSIQHVGNKDIEELIRNEEILDQYLSSLVPMRNVFERILSNKYIAINEEHTDLLEDVVNSITQSLDVCKVNLRSIQRLRDSYQIIFTNNLNRVIKFLTSVTIIMTIPTIISSIFGMNVALPLADQPYAFAMVLGISAVLAIVLFSFFYFKRWF